MRPWLAWFALPLCAAGVARAGQHEPVVLTDPAGDAGLRATRSAGAGPAPSGSPADVLSLSVLPWASPTPASDPYSGSIQVSNPHLVRIDTVFAGLVCPPGTLGLGGQPFAPFAFGPSPVYGFVEFDADSDKDTGGELGAGAGSRYLAVVGRFGERPNGSVGERMARWADDVDLDFNTTPQIERSGQDFSLVLCGCFGVSIVQRLAGDSDNEFESGEVWVVRGRFFQRAGGYQEASAAFGGTAPGLYDPQVNLRWAHDATTGRTTVSLVAALTPTGAGMLAGQPAQPIDYNVGNQTSVEEALQDVIDGVNWGGFSGPAWTLSHRWEGEDVSRSLDPTRWEAAGAFAIPYSWPGGFPFAWTDSIGAATLADFTGDGVADGLDLTELLGVVAAGDGGPGDCDGVVNGAIMFCDPGPDWSVYDVNNDGVIRAADFPACAGDTNGDRLVDFLDLNVVLSNYGATGAPGPGAGDVDGDGDVDFGDLNIVLGAFGTSC